MLNFTLNILHSPHNINFQSIKIKAKRKTIPQPRQRVKHLKSIRD